MALCIAASLAGMVLHVKQNLKFMPNGFMDNTEFFSLTGQYHSYGEIGEVYYKPSRVTDFGVTLDFPSYVLVLKDGTEFDLYEYEELSQYESTLIPYLLSKGIEFRKE